MKWNIEKSNELKVRIAKDESLLKELSKKISVTFKKFDVDLGGKSYLFEPRVFSMDKGDAPSLLVKSREALAVAVVSDLFREGVHRQFELADLGDLLGVCLPYCGPYDPFHLDWVERFRISDSDVSGPVRTSVDLMQKIVGNKALLKGLSSAIFEVLDRHKVTFGKGEGCVFTPLVFDKPVFAQRVGVAKRVSDIRGFGPQVFEGGLNLERVPQVHGQPEVGIVELQVQGEVAVLPAAIAKAWWWTGIPAPEMLAAVDVMKGMR